MDEAFYFKLCTIFFSAIPLKIVELRNSFFGKQIRRGIDRFKGVDTSRNVYMLD